MINQDEYDQYELGALREFHLNLCMIPCIQLHIAEIHYGPFRKWQNSK